MSAVSAPPAAGISIREFAKREKCSDKLVRRAIEREHLRLLPDGKLDPALVGSGWCERNRRAADTPADTSADRGADTSADTADTQTVRTEVSAAEKPKRATKPQATIQPADAIATADDADDLIRKILAEGGAPFSLAEAERLKENYLALLRQLEFDMKSGAVVLVADIAKAVGSEYAKVRTRLLAIPSEQAPRIQRLKTVAEVEDVLREVITEALEELTRDGVSST